MDQPNDLPMGMPEPPLRLCGRSSVAEYLDDFIVYRGLQPQDPRLPRLDALLADAGLPVGSTPRKHEEDYARLVAHLLSQARRLDQPNLQLERLVFLGDTRLSDISAFTHICLAAGWEGMAFIGSENQKPAALVKEEASSGLAIYLANRWSLLNELEYDRRQQHFPVDEHTVIVIDLDKTAIGARGRNAAVIDQARLEAVRQTVAALLEGSFDPESFQSNYNRLNQPEFHPFTADNQDYLAYICLVMGSGLYNPDELVQRIRCGGLKDFDQFISEVDRRQDQLRPALLGIHKEIYARYSAGDPTPFKAFRRNEYCATASRMGCALDETPLDRLLAEEIVLTQEVRSLVLEWKANGAMLFGLSDKPDEASLPTPELAAKGWLPLHRIVTHVVGS